MDVRSNSTSNLVIASFVQKVRFSKSNLLSLRLLSLKHFPSRSTKVGFDVYLSFIMVYFDCGACRYKVSDFMTINSLNHASYVQKETCRIPKTMFICVCVTLELWYTSFRKTLIENTQHAQHVLYLSFYVFKLR